MGRVFEDVLWTGSMADSDRRRSPRYLLGAKAKVHVGATRVEGTVRDVSKHGMGLVVPAGTEFAVGDLVWIVAETLAPYAITATVVRTELEGILGVELEEVLHGETLDSLTPVTLTQDVPSQENDGSEGEPPPDSASESSSLERPR